MKISQNPQTGGILIIAVVLVGAVLYAAQDVFAPMALGIIVAVIAAPLMDIGARLRIPTGLSATLLLITTMLLIAALVFAAEPVVARLQESLPLIRFELRSIVADMREAFRGIDEMGEDMKAALGDGDGGGDGGDDGAEGPDVPTVTDALFLAPVILGQFLIFAGTFFFFLSGRQQIYAFAAKRLSNVGESGLIRRRFQTAERMVSRYFVTISLINTALGFATSFLMWTIGMPMPWIWGLAAGLLNFVLYVGPAVMWATFLIAGVVQFEGLMVLAPAALYACVNLTEAQFVTPGLVGKQVELNPLLVFVALVFGLWFWGPIGGIVAIPILVIVIALTDDHAGTGSGAVTGSAARAGGSDA